MLRRRFGLNHYKNTAYDTQHWPVRTLRGASGCSQAIRHGDGGRAHAPALSGLPVAHPVHAAQRPGLRLAAVEPRALLAGQRMDGLAAGPGRPAGDPGGGVRLGDSQPPGATGLAPHVPARLRRQRPDPGLRRHRPDAHRQFPAAGLGLRPDRRGDPFGQRGLCGQPAGLPVLYLALFATGDRLPVLGRRRAAAWLGLAGLDPAGVAERGGLAGQPFDPDGLAAALPEPGPDRTSATGAEP